MLPATAHYNQATDVVEMCWPTAPLPLAVLQTQYATLLAALHTHHTHRALLDHRAAPLATPEAANWMVEHWLPVLQKELAPQRPRLAYLLYPGKSSSHSPVSPQSHSIDKYSLVEQIVMSIPYLPNG